MNQYDTLNMNVILQIESLQGLWIILFIISIIGLVLRLVKYGEKKDQLNQMIDKLGNEFPNLDAFLTKENSFEFVAKSTQESWSIPEILTIRYLTILTERTITTGILPQIAAMDKGEYYGKIFLVNEVSEWFRMSMASPLQVISELSEKKNIFYISKGVVAEEKKPDGSVVSQNGILILGLHYLMFYPSSEFQDVDFEKLEEALMNVTEKIPLLNLGISSAFIIGDISNSLEDEKTLFSEGVKEKFLSLVYENKAIIIEYNDIERVHYAKVGDRMSGLAKFSFTSVNSFKYSFWRYKDNLDLIDVLFENILSLALVNGNLLLPENLTDGHNYVSFSRAVQGEVKIESHNGAVSAPVVKIEPEPLDLSKIDESKLKRLNTLILAQQKKIFGGTVTTEMREVLNDIVKTKEDGIQLLSSYHSILQKDLVEELTKLNSRYDAIRENLSLFIELDIIEEKFPHGRK